MYTTEIRTHEKEIKLVLLKQKSYTYQTSIDADDHWITFTEKLYDEVENIVDDHEAFGYLCHDNQGYDYYAACQVTGYGDIGSFEKKVIPAGDYLYIEIENGHKGDTIKKLQKELLLDEGIDPEFTFEFYPTTFNYNDPKSMLYYVIPKVS